MGVVNLKYKTGGNHAVSVHLLLLEDSNKEITRGKPQVGNLGHAVRISQ